MQDLAPLALFVFKRVDTLKKVIPSLLKNNLATQTPLYIYSDGPRSELEKHQIDEVRQYIRSVKGFKTVSLIESNRNKGLATSIIDGVTSLLKRYTSVIVLEDDLMVSENFLSYMNEALQFYKKAANVFSIAGYTFPIKVPDGYPFENYFTMRSSSWGWATWSDRWEKIDWEVVDYNQFIKNPQQQKAFNKMGSDLSGMLKNQMLGKMDSWAIRWVYHQFKHNLYSVHPVHSKVRNIGFGEKNATHTVQRFNRYDTVLDKRNNYHFQFNPQVECDPYFIKKFTAKYSIKQRVFYKILNSFA